jgi:hypothetical protein
MKALLPLIIICISVNAFCQITTQEEYKYVSYGYKNHLRDGSDFKQGYTLTDLNSFDFQWSDMQRTVSFKGFYKNGADKPSAVMLVYHARGGDNYFCIPGPESDNSLWVSFDQSIENFFNGKNGFNPATATLVRSMARMISSSEMK